MSGYTVIRSRRRTLALQVTKDCRVVVRAPLYAAGDDIDRFVAEPGSQPSLPGRPSA